MNDVIKTAPIVVNTMTDVFYTWLVLFRGIHKLSASEMKFVAVILKKRYELSYKVIDDELLDEMVLSPKGKIRKEVQKELGYDADTRIPNLLTSCKAKGFLTADNRINKIFIPNISKDFKQMDIHFNIKLNEKK